MMPHIDAVTAQKHHLKPTKTAVEKVQSHFATQENETLERFE